LLDRKIYINTPIGVLGTHWVHNILHFKSDVFEELKRKYPNSKYDEDFIRQLKMHNLLDSLPILAESDENIVARVVFHADVIPYISQLKQHFTQLNLSDVAGFSSFYSFRIYILMMQFVKTGLVLIKLDEFRSILELTDKYEAVKDLRKWVLDTAIDEINAKSPYAVSYELMDKNGKTGRGVKLTHLQIKFKAKEKPQKQALERDPNTIDWVNGATDNEAKIAPTWQAKGLSDGQIKKIGVNKQEFIDANSGKISPNDRRGYDEIFEDWKPQLKDPSKVNSFNKIQELLDRQRPS
jgi:plasmid replication initiation protein